MQKLGQKEYKTRYVSVWKMILWELYKNRNLTILPNSICPNQNLNETHNILCDFEIQRDHLIPARRPCLVLVDPKKRERAE